MESEVQDLDQILAHSSYISELLKRLVGISQKSNQLPTADELSFYKKNPSVSERCKNINRLLTRNLTKLNNFSNSKSKIDPTKTNITIKYNDVIETLDVLLENVDTNLDKINVKNVDNSISVMPDKNEISKINKMGDEIEKPQKAYIIDNFDNDLSRCFIPKIMEKDNSVVPLDTNIKTAQNNPELFFEINKNINFEFSHPYQYEIENLNFFIQTEIEIQMYTKFEKEKYEYIETEEALNNLIAKLELCSEFAVDLEHNHMRSFQGLTCLIQISTRTEDFIIDPFKLWKSLYKLNKVFTNPKIIKVFHGADNDIQWLQRDFGVYVVNMFDTGQASRQLKLESYSFAYLLSYYCNVHASKAYQLADWRIRPLHKDMIKYAREDVHYLLYIYDRIRLDLVNKSLESGFDKSQFIYSVLNKSKEICLKTYTKPILKDDSYYNLMLRNKQILSTIKVKLLKKLLIWRFNIAAKEDESPAYVLPNNIMFSIVDKAPKLEKDLLILFKKNNNILKKYCLDILEIINNNYNEIEIEKKNNEILPQLKEEIIEPIAKLNINIEENINYNKTFNEKTINSQIIIKSHENNFIFNNKNSTSSNKINDIRNSFNYSHTSQFFVEKFPQIKKLFSEAESISQKIPNLDINEPEITNKELLTVNIKKDDDFIQFSKEKGEKPIEKASKSHKLIDTRQNNNTIPMSIHEKYGVAVNDLNKKRKLDNSQNKDIKPIKKIKNEEIPKSQTKNKFDVLINDEENEGESKYDIKQFEQKYKEISQKINENFNKAPQKYQKKPKEFDILDKIANKYDVNQTKSNKKNKNTKFANKNKVFSLKEL